MKNLYSITRAIFIAFIFLLAAVVVKAQNVGINKTNPSEALDVNGNINVAGTIKANGSDGAPNQVLMKNGSGSLSWGNVGGDFKNFVAFDAVSSGWPVPPGVSKIQIEIWGGGGGGNVFAGGGGGGYMMAVFPVINGDVVLYTVGGGGGGALTTNGNPGEITSINLNSMQMLVTGGSGASYTNSSTGTAGYGGSALPTGGGFTFISIPGRSGAVPEKKFFQYNATTWYETGHAAPGGYAGNTSNEYVGQGAYYIHNTTSNTVVQRVECYDNGIFPGGGGGSGLVAPGANFTGKDGAGGLVLIRY